jgi:hypothetical protein
VAGTFRSDLFYRLNVFPIELPPLRERKEDISLLVDHFIELYASKAGKKIQPASDETLAALQSYSWPGNIRELQNVIERSVIVCETENFIVDESWLSESTFQPPLAGERLSEKLVAQEKEMIDAALAEAGGRVAGPNGAAARLGMPPSTLESKIKAMNISSSIARHPRTRIQRHWWSGCWQAILGTRIDDLSLHFLFPVEQINAPFALFANLDLVAGLPARWKVAGKTFVADDVFFLCQGDGDVIKRIAIEDGNSAFPVCDASLLMRFD